MTSLLREVSRFSRETCPLISQRKELWDKIVISLSQNFGDEINKEYGKIEILNQFIDNVTTHKHEVIVHSAQQIGYRIATRKPATILNLCQISFNQGQMKYWLKKTNDNNPQLLALATTNEFLPTKFRTDISNRFVKYHFEMSRDNDDIVLKRFYLI